MKRTRIALLTKERHAVKNLTGKIAGTVAAVGLIAAYSVSIPANAQTTTRGPATPAAPAGAATSNHVPVGGSLAPPNSTTPPVGGSLTAPTGGTVVPGGQGLPAPGGNYPVIPNSGFAVPPVGGSLNTPANNLAAGNYFRPYGTNGYYRWGTNNNIYFRGTNGFYEHGLNGRPGQFYPDGNLVYRRGPDGLYRWYNNQVIYPANGGVQVVPGSTGAVINNRGLGFQTNDPSLGAGRVLVITNNSQP